jgi:DNA-binding NarL/FixJ family response regulator
MPPECRPRVLLADDSPQLLVALRRLLEPWCDVVGSVSSGHEAVEAATNLRPDVMVLDFRLHDLNGLDACREVRQRAPDVSVVLLTASDDERTRTKALEVGASAFVPKHAAGDELVRAIERIVATRPGSSRAES